ncbi:ankyrin and het domain protein [Fusarium oxysporum f. sp. phaseoli]
MPTYIIPDFVAKPKPRLDNRGFREQGSKVAEERIKKLRSRLSLLDASGEQLKTEQQRLCAGATRVLEETLGLQHNNAFNKGVNRELKNLISRVAEHLNNTKEAFTKETNDIQDLVGKPNHLPQDVGSIREMRKQSQIRKERRKKTAFSEINRLKSEIKSLQSRLEESKGRSVEAISGEDEGGEGADDRSDDEEHLRREIEEKEQKIEVCQRNIDKLNEELRKMSQSNKGYDKNIEEEEQGEDKTLKLLMKKKEEKEIQDSKDQDERKNNLDQLDNRIWSMRGGTNSHYDSSSRMRFYRYRLLRMMDLELLDEDYYRRRPESRPLGIMAEPDSSDETDTETQKTVSENCLRWLERQIGNAQTLENFIEMLQHSRQKMEGMENLKRVLINEMSLEEKWLDSLDSPKSLEVPGPSSFRLSRQKDHLSGGHLPDDEIYSPLNFNEFRVLILLPAPDPCFPLVCKLEKWSMDEISHSASTGQPSEKQYLALSYFWGPDVCNGRIYLLSEDDLDVPSPDDFSQWGAALKRATRIRIRNNLFRALLRLRMHGPDSQAVAIWVDFLSIKQKDVEEKTAQLGRMVDIYSNASQVCIWLGESDSGGPSDQAMKFIPTIMDFALFERYARDKSQAMKWFGLGELMRDRWFSRRWVVQEMALAKEATVHCGERAVRWSDFTDAASLLVSNQAMIKSLFDFSDWREGQNTLGAVESFGAWILLESTGNLFRRKPNGEIRKPIKSIEYLVTSLKTFDTSNTRDLIYSLVSIASDTSRKIWHHDNGGDEEEDMDMDYNKSEVAVYQDFTRFCVESSKSLDVICRPWAMPLEEAGTLPSWIPLLDKSEFGEPEEVYTGRKNGDNLVGPAGSPTYEASGRSKCEVEFQNQVADSNPLEAKVLVAKGFRLATVHKVSPRNTGGVILRETLQMIGWEGFQRESNSVPSQVWRTLVADRDLDGRVAPSWYQRACLRCLEIAHMFNNGDLNVGEILQGHSDMLVKYLKRVQNVTWNRRFFTAGLCEEEVEALGKEAKDEGQEQEQEQEREQGDGDGDGDGDGEGEGEDFNEEAGQVQSPAEKQDKTRHEGTPVSNETSQGTDSLIIGEYEAEEVRNGEGGVEKNDDHGSEVHEAFVQVGGEKPEGEESGNNEDNDQTAKDEMADNEKISEEATKDNDASNDEEGDLAKEEVGESLPSEGLEEEESDHVKLDHEESLKDESSEPDASEDGLASGDTTEDEDGTGEERDTENPASQDSDTLLGLCPPETKDGDFICILYGCSVPVVLRKTQEGQMILIGEAYVHGKMDGEAMEDFPDRTPKTFHIQ